jgi:hypothetical protein
MHPEKRKLRKWLEREESRRIAHQQRRELELVRMLAQADDDVRGLYGLPPRPWWRRALGWFRR